MSNNLLNRAKLTYAFGDTSETVLSNTTETALVESYAVEVTKDAIADEVVVGSDAVYVIRVKNSCSAPLYNVAVSDNLGGYKNSKTPLSYVKDSAKFYLNGNEISGTAKTLGTKVEFSISQVMQAGDNLIVIYAATLVSQRATTVTNKATVFANGGSPRGRCVNDSDTATITSTTYDIAGVSMFKSADKAAVVCGDNLTYTFTLLNTGAREADSIRLEDALPEKFDVKSVAYAVGGGAEIPISHPNYWVTSNNTLTVPSKTSSLVIDVPAATEDGPGMTTIIVRGTVK